MEALNLSGSTVLVTGANGFIGTHLCRRLLEFDVEIHALSRTNQNDSKKTRWWQGDLSDANTARSLMQAIRPTYIFHLASFVKGSRDLAFVMPTFQNNLLGKVHLMYEASKTGCKKFISTGSMEEPSSNSTWKVATSPYAAAKQAARVYGEMFHALYGLPYVALRLFMVYGPGQTDVSKLIPYSILSMLRGKAPELTSGQRKIDWIFIEDVVEGILAAATTPGIEGLRLDLGSGVPVTIQSVEGILTKLIDPGMEPIYGALNDRPYEQEPVANTSETYTKISWKPEISLEKGLEKTVQWYRENMDRFLGA